MEFSSTLIQTPLFPSLLASCVVFLGWLLLIWRAGTVHALLDRIWRLLYGNADAEDSVVIANLQESRDVERFNYAHRLKLETLTSIHKLEKWRKKHDVGMSRIRRVRMWINTNIDEIVSLPPKRYVAATMLLGLAGAILAFCVGMIAASPYALLQMRTSGVWFKTDAVVAKGAFGGWAFDAEKCASDRSGIEDLTGFKTKEVAFICDALRTGDLKASVIDNVRSQKWFGLSVSLVIAYWAFRALLAANSAASARLLRRQLYPGFADNDKKQTNAQSTLG
ncbi:DUF6216 family protein [Achromobacter aloeverae]|uniref:Uncharacterized protein n=1 Tax=Achromobacter aloeverae TaxID=1750518 RepID=A0A4Q1HPG5_9BURK|nr:DUF6216 family protein [Achromobacter aloeverae]RXN92829.1 hypothetical protein C7R54_03545 [Achromobacter aloeverae]